MFKKISVLLLVVLMMSIVVSCGVKQSVDEKIAEKVTEGVLNKATGDQVDLDYKDGKVTMKGEDGKEVTFAENEWPSGTAADKIPEIKSGKIISSISSDEACIIIIEEVDLEDFEKYLEDIKSSGFVNDASEFNSDPIKMYSASLDDATLIYVTYDGETKTLSVNLEISQ